MDLNIQPGFDRWWNEPVRRGSLEVDYGRWWTLHGDERAFPRWRVSWIARTGELYAVHGCRERQFFIVLGVYPTRTEVEQALEGWEIPGGAIYHNLSVLAGRLSVMQIT
jgi:hypothetical protein